MPVLSSDTGEREVIRNANDYQLRGPAVGALLRMKINVIGVRSEIPAPAQHDLHIILFRPEPGGYGRKWPGGFMCRGEVTDGTGF
jgi:hypothetical protein